MAERDIVQLFNRYKEEFLKKFSQQDGGDGEERTRVWQEFKKFLDRFEHWLQSEDSEGIEEDTSLPGEKSFDQFLDEVLAETKRILAEQNIDVTYTLPGQNLGISESWKCVKVFGNNNIYYRIGRTRPRKGPYRGQELLVIDLVMDGYKKQVFLPLLELKSEIEKRIGAMLERELPRVEATGKYRLKVILPFEVVHKGDTWLAARKFADFVAVTKPLINSLGIH
ncbi:hypothetical protein SAMN02745218_00558 [Desulfofundulus australicus DSM 11792]|uniref:Uncharacterized protein n=1 Tax=Desulfofundulus australicus DSM 11792 TaxID=1121425 RepID=A0A1M4USF1_9FIRM|nr:hypothetical protein [Desulfofundulus australicus]SHE59624.1 hypothetical protein SAMN02745218_00558 [Desulfofundulus australicus DSM 11792]